MNTAPTELEIEEFHIACNEANMTAVNTFLKKFPGHADCTRDDPLRQKVTPLMHAAIGHIDLIHLLLDHGAKIDQQSTHGMTAFLYACLYGNVAAAAALKARGADTTINNVDNYTPVHLAAQCGHTNMLQYLKEQGFDFNAENKKKLTPLEMLVDTHIETQHDSVSVACIKYALPVIANGGWIRENTTFSGYENIYAALKETGKTQMLEVIGTQARVIIAGEAVKSVHNGVTEKIFDNGQVKISRRNRSWFSVN